MNKTFRPWNPEQTLLFPAEPGDGVLIGELIDQTKPLGGICSHRKRKAFGLRTVRRRQPEKILLPPELTVLLADPVELGALLAGEEALATRAGLALWREGRAGGRQRCRRGPPAGRGPWPTASAEE